MRTREGMAIARAKGRLRGKHPKFPRWAKAYRGEDGVTQLVSDALEVLSGFGLVRVEGGLVHPRPAAARYTLGAMRTTDPDIEEFPS